VKVWRDPAATITTIEDLLQRGVDPDRVARAVANDPSAYGPLRGNDRVMDRLLAPGRERKDALASIETVSDRVRAMGRAWQNALDVEKQAVTADRDRMAVPVPGLSERAEAELKRLVAAVEKTPKDLTKLARGVDPTVRAEFAAVSKALDARFGPNAIARGDKDAIDRVPAAQHKVFEAMQVRLRVLQNAVRADRAQAVIAERQNRALNQARGRTI
jgi:hypothetical protein